LNGWVLESRWSLFGLPNALSEAMKKPSSNAAVGKKGG